MQILDVNSADLEMRLVNHASLLIVEEDEKVRLSLAEDMEAKGYTVTAVPSLSEGRAALTVSPPAFAVLGLRLPDGNGLDLIPDLKSRRPDMRALVLTDYGSVASAVTAIRAGAFDYLPKPADAEGIHNALTASTHDKAALPKHAMTADQVRWKHILSIYESCSRNVSETARKLRMHRRTLQRILRHHSPH